MLRAIGWVCIGLSAIVAALNLSVVVASAIEKKPKSFCLLIGGVFGVAGFVLVPSARGWSWLTVVLDLGTMPLLFTIPAFCWTLYRTNRHLFRVYDAASPTKKVQLALYLPDRLTLLERPRSASSTVEVVRLSLTGTWRESGGRLDLTFGGESAVLIPRLDGDPGDLEPSPETDPSSRLAGLIFHLQRDA